LIKNPNVRLNNYHDVHDAYLNDFVSQKSDAEAARAKLRQALHFYPSDDCCNAKLFAIIIIIIVMIVIMIVIMIIITIMTRSSLVQIYVMLQATDNKFSQSYYNKETAKASERW
jgi:type IV secretory pathway VirB6-like protein